MRGIAGMLRADATRMTSISTKGACWLNRILSTLTNCWHMAQVSSAGTKTPCPCPASKTEVSNKTIAAAVSQMRSFWVEWRINLNMSAI